MEEAIEKMPPPPARATQVGLLPPLGPTPMAEVSRDGGRLSLQESSAKLPQEFVTGGQVGDGDTPGEDPAGPWAAAIPKGLHCSTRYTGGYPFDVETALKLAGTAIHCAT